MGGYSQRAHELAEELAEKAAENLRRSGRTVERDAVSGRYIVSREAADRSTVPLRRSA